MKFIEVVDTDKRKILINLENIIQIRPDGHGNTDFVSITTVIKTLSKYERVRTTLTGLVPTPSIPE